MIRYPTSTQQTVDRNLTQNQENKIKMRESENNKNNIY